MNDSRVVQPAPAAMDIQIQVHPSHELVQLSIRKQFDVTPHLVFLPFSMVDIMCHAVLTVRLQKLGVLPQAGGAVPAVPSSPVPGSADARGASPILSLTNGKAGL